MSSENIFQRLGLLAELAGRARLGRTALMKLLFFLQESKGVPLGYQFSLYSYGPFDSDVLADISTAERLNVLKSSVVYYPSGMGYEYSSGSDLKSVRDLAGPFLQEHNASIDWVLENFARKTAADLELLSTILFVAKYENPPTAKKLIEKVELIKPHFSQKQIQAGFEELVGFNILRHQPPRT
jgi:uncharacterized protein